MGLMLRFPGFRHLVAMTSMIAAGFFALPLRPFVPVTVCFPTSGLAYTLGLGLWGVYLSPPKLLRSYEAQKPKFSR